MFGMFSYLPLFQVFQASVWITASCFILVRDKERLKDYTAEAPRAQRKEFLKKYSDLSELGVSVVKFRLSETVNGLPQNRPGSRLFAIFNR